MSLKYQMGRITSEAVRNSSRKKFCRYLRKYFSTFSLIAFNNLSLIFLKLYP